MERWEESALKEIKYSAKHNYQDLERDARLRNLEIDWYMKEYIKALIKIKNELK